MEGKLPRLKAVWKRGEVSGWRTFFFLRDELCRQIAEIVMQAQSDAGWRRSLNSKSGGSPK